jgi:hypothetical protein
LDQKGRAKSGGAAQRASQKITEQAGAKPPNVRLRVLPNVSYNEIAGDVKATANCGGEPEG